MAKEELRYRENEKPETVPDVVRRACAASERVVRRAITRYDGSESRGLLETAAAPATAGGWRKEDRDGCLSGALPLSLSFSNSEEIPPRRRPHRSSCTPAHMHTRTHINSSSLMRPLFSILGALAPVQHLFYIIFYNTTEYDFPFSAQ